MGVSWSNGNRRRYNNYPVNPGPSQSAAAAATPFYTSDPPSFSSSAPFPPPPNYVLAANAPFTPPPPPYPCQSPYAAPPPPPPPPHQSYYQYNTSGYTGGPIMGRLNYQPHPPPPPGRWHTIPTPSVAAPRPPPLPLVEQHEAKKIRNAVNVHKDTITLQLDDTNPDCHLLSFTFDALVDGSITIFYFGKEGVDCTFMPLYPKAHVPLKVPFEKGLRQKFHQSSGTGFDLGFFELDDLLKPSPGEDVFPLVIYAEACSSLPPTSEQLHQTLPTTSHAQITQAVIQKNNGGTFQGKVIKQILWVDRVRYELREIYGIGTSAETSFDDTDPGKECVICMSEPKDTAVLPCRHMCMCSECAKELKLQTNKCPICRQPIEELIEIKVNKSD